MFRGLVFAERQMPAQLQFLAFPNLSNQALTGTWRFDRCNTSMLDKDVASSAEGPDCLMQARPTPGLSLTASKQKQLIMTSVNVFYEMYNFQTRAAFAILLSPFVTFGRALRELHSCTLKGAKGSCQKLLS